MSAPNGEGGGGGEDFCEYVYNPLMRQYQAMMRLIQMLRDSQSDCNDVECYTGNAANSPFNALRPSASASDAGSFGAYLPMLLIWGLFVVVLFMLRPSSMRRSNREARKDSQRGPSTSGRDRFNARRDNFNDDDDDDSTVS